MTTTTRPPVPAPRPASARPARATAGGLLAGAGAVVLAELVARVLPRAGSPLVAVADGVIRLAPPAARDGAIALVGTLDKPLLLAGVLLVVLAAAGLAGRLQLRNPAAAGALVAALALLAGVAVAQDGGGLLDGLSIGLVLLVAGTLLLRLLVQPARVPAAPAEDRRAFLRAAGGVAVLVVAGGGLLRLLDLRGQVASAARAALRLPVPVRPAPGDAASVELGLPGLTPLVTPNGAFYRIDTALFVPQVDPAGWTLEIGGMVDRPLSFTLDELLALPQVEADITLQCVSNEVGGDLVGLARWQGVLLRDLLAQAGVQPGAGQVVGRSVDDFTAGFPLSYATDDRFAMVALGMNGELLPVEHGFPARLVVPGLYGYVSATKWLQSITVTTWRGVRRLLGAARLVEARRPSRSARGSTCPLTAPRSRPGRSRWPAWPGRPAGAVASPRCRCASTRGRGGRQSSGAP